MTYYLKVYVGGLESALRRFETESEAKEYIATHNNVKQVINGKDVSNKFLRRKSKW